MWDVSPRKVLVVASADCDAALLYAADEARRRSHVEWIGGGMELKLA